MNNKSFFLNCFKLLERNCFLSYSVVSFLVFPFLFSGTGKLRSNQIRSRISRREICSRKYVLGFREVQKISPSLSLSPLSPSLPLSIVLFLSLYMFVYLFFVRPSVCPSVCPSVHPSKFLSFFFSSRISLFKQKLVIFIVPKIRDENGNFFLFPKIGGETCSGTVFTRISGTGET